MELMASEVCVRTITVTNPQGVHARPAELLIRLAQQFASRIEILRDSERLSAKSMMDVLMLGAEQGTQLVFEASGDDANAALDEIEKLFARNFDE
jgi:phosphocarrier protein HPr